MSEGIRNYNRFGGRERRKENTSLRRERAIRQYTDISRINCQTLRISELNTRKKNCYFNQ